MRRPVYVRYGNMWAGGAGLGVVAQRVLATQRHRSKETLPCYIH